MEAEELATATIDRHYVYNYNECTAYINAHAPLSHAVAQPELIILHGRQYGEPRTHLGLSLTLSAKKSEIQRTYEKLLKKTDIY